MLCFMDSYKGGKGEGIGSFYYHVLMNMLYISKLILFFKFSIFCICFLVMMYFTSMMLFSCFVMICQGLFFSLMFFSMFLFMTSYFSYGSNKDNIIIIFNFKVGYFSGLKEFMFCYFMYESFSDLLFIVSYVLNFEVLYESILLFKQGLFPFFIYSFYLMSICLSFYFISFYFMLFLFLSKLWSILLFSKMVFCLEFYFFYIFMTTIYILISYKGEFMNFMMKGMVLNNLLLFLMCKMFPFYMVSIYSFIIILFYFMMYKNLCSNNGKLFKNEEDMFLNTFILLIMHGGPVSFMMAMKVFCLIIILQYSYFMSMFYFVVSSLYLCFSILNYINLNSVKSMGITKMIYSYFLYFLGVMVFVKILFMFLMFKYICEGCLLF